LYERTNLFLAGVVINSAKTVGQKVGGSRIGEPRGTKSGGGGLGHRSPKGVYAYVKFSPFVHCPCLLAMAMPLRTTCEQRMSDKCIRVCVSCTNDNDKLMNEFSHQSRQPQNTSIHIIDSRYNGQQLHRAVLHIYRFTNSSTCLAAHYQHDTDMFSAAGDRHVICGLINNLDSSSRSFQPVCVKGW